MSPQATKSSHPLLSCTDGIAAGMSDILLLIARLLVAAVFLMTVWTGGPAATYLKSINFIAPDIMSTLAHIVEWIIVVTLVLGVATRYGALLAFAFVVIALVTAHLYWQFPAAAQTLQYVIPQQGSIDRRRYACAVRGRWRALQRRPYAGGQIAERCE